MALELLFKTKIEKGKEIAMHPEANYYKLDKGYFMQFRVNPTPGKEMIKMPLSTNFVVFEKYEDNRGEDYHGRIRGWVNYGKPVFYSHGGNVL
jgi:hypothetical protein